MAHSDDEHLEDPCDPAAANARDHAAAHAVSYAGAGERFARCCTIPVLLEQLAASAGTREALVFYSGTACERRLRYDELLEGVATFAGVLQGALGIRPGDRVALVSANAPELCVAALAVMASGAIAVPVNDKESEAAIGYVLEHSGAKIVLCQDGTSATVPVGICPRLSFGEVRPSRVTERALPILVEPDSIALIIYTSGTTARPKGVCLSHYNLCINAEALQRVHGLHPESRSLCVLPLFYMNAFGFSLVTTLYTGACLVLCDEFPGPSVWSIIAAERVSIASLVPSLLRVMLLRPRTARDLPHLRHVISAAAALPPALARAFHEATGIRICHGYGLTETTNFSATLPPDTAPGPYGELMHAGEHASIGPALLGCELAICDAQGRALPPGEVGEIVVRGHSVMLGYWQDPQATRDAFRGGVFHTGDLGFAADVDGIVHYFVAGRIKELIIRGGRNLSPLAIERELADLAGLGAFAVTGVDNVHVGEEIALYVCGPDTPERRQRVQEIVGCCPEPSRPRFALLSEEPIAATRMGKVQRRKLAPRFARCAELLGNAQALRFL